MLPKFNGLRIKKYNYFFCKSPREVFPVWMGWGGVGWENCFIELFKDPDFWRLCRLHGMWLPDSQKRETARKERKQGRATLAIFSAFITPVTPMAQSSELLGLT